MGNYVLIPARAGSSLKDKNFMMLSGKPVLFYTCHNALKLDLPVYFSTDSEKYMEYVKDTFPTINVFRRSDIACSDTANTTDVMLDFIFQKNLKAEDNIIYLRPTTPYRPNFLNVKPVFKEWKSKTFFNSLRSAHEMAEPIAKKYYLSGDDLEWEKIDCEDVETIEDADNNRQEFRKSFEPNGFFDCARVSAIIDLKHAFPSPIKAFINSRVPELDSEEDIPYLEFIMGRGI